MYLINWDIFRDIAMEQISHESVMNVPAIKYAFIDRSCESLAACRVVRPIPAWQKMHDKMNVLNWHGPYGG